MSKAIPIVMLWLSILGIFGCWLGARALAYRGKVDSEFVLASIGLIALAIMCALVLNRAAKAV